MGQSSLRTVRRNGLGLAVTATVSLAATAVFADQVFIDDLIVDGSACIGQDCVNGENFGFDTIRLKENNLRIKFDDTSNSGSFPFVDWQITANDSSNGGANKFSIDDITNSRTPFTIEANTPTNTLYVDSNKRIGIGTATPAVTLHLKDGNTPTLRLEQDGSSGFSAQTWDVAGNETNFFVRDTTNGSKLPFKIRPNAPTNSLYLDTDGSVGLGTATPDAALHVIGDTLILDDADHGAAPANANLYIADGDDEAIIQMNDGSDGDDLLFALKGDKLFISFEDTIGAELTIRHNGQVEVGLGDLEVNNGHNLVLSGGGSVVVNGSTLNVPDYVFGPEYDLMPLTELAAFIDTNSHLPGVPSAAEVSSGGLDLTQMQLALLEKVEEQTLYILQLQGVLAQQQEQIDTLHGLVAAR